MAAEKRLRRRPTHANNHGGGSGAEAEHQNRPPIKVNPAKTRREEKHALGSKRSVKQPLMQDVELLCQCQGWNRQGERAPEPGKERTLAHKGYHGPKCVQGGDEDTAEAT